MREAAVSLLGRHAASNQALALRLFNTLAKVGTGELVWWQLHVFCWGWGSLVGARLSLERLPKGPCAD